MAQSPIIKTLDDMLAKLKDATETYREAGKAVAQYTAAIRALAHVCEDEEVKNEYLLRLEELNGKQGFVDAIRFVLKRGKAFTPTEIRQMIVLTGKMSLSGYSNPMASIHTTLRRMKESEEIEEVQTSEGERAYRFPPGSPGITLPNQADVAEGRLNQDRLGGRYNKPKGRYGGPPVTEKT